LLRPTDAWAPVTTCDAPLLPRKQRFPRLQRAPKATWGQAVARDSVTLS